MALFACANEQDTNTHRNVLMLLSHLSDALLNCALDCKHRSGLSISLCTLDRPCLEEFWGAFLVRVTLRETAPLSTSGLMCCMLYVACNCHLLACWHMLACSGMPADTPSQ
eukprot:1160499-Pelagomonas_calceolata.AAC.1